MIFTKTLQGLVSIRQMYLCKAYDSSKDWLIGTVTWLKSLIGHNFVIIRFMTVDPKNNDLGKMSPRF